MFKKLFLTLLTLCVCGYLMSLSFDMMNTKSTVLNFTSLFVILIDVYLSVKAIKNIIKLKN